MTSGVASSAPGSGAARPGESPMLAVVGLACEYPDAHGAAELWDNVLAGRRAFRRIPAERLRVEDYFSADRTVPDSMYSTRAAVLEGWDFDRVGHRIAGGTYRVADLAHWLALDVAGRALADAGFPDGEDLPRARTGVVLGNTLTGETSRSQILRLRWPYVRRTVGAELLRAGWDAERTAGFLAQLEASFKAPFPAPTEETLAGGLANTIAGRIANHFDLGGGGFTVDGACSSSLLAVAQASQALLLGDVDVALAGGVDISLDPFELVGFARTGALAQGPMRVFDARPTGFIPGEGCGFVVLMRLADALDQGRRIYAVVRGWGISSDGSGGITRPEVEGQKRALLAAYRRAGYGIGTVGYFEGHGTGTPVGDETELTALTAARREAGPDVPPAAVGSIKANIGHTKAAAGVAAVLKAVMALDRQVIPPTTGCDEPHPLLQGPDRALRPVDTGDLWPSDLPLRTGVSSMGFGGINVHLTLEALEQLEASGASPAVCEGRFSRPRRRRLSALEQGHLTSRQDAEVFLLASRDRQGLTAVLERLAALARRISLAELADLAAWLASDAGRRSAAGWRAALVAGEPEELARGVEILQGWLEEDTDENGDRTALRHDGRRGIFLRGNALRPGHGSSAHGSPRLGFLFPGQASPPHLDGGAWARRFPEVAALYRRLHRRLPEIRERGGVLDTSLAQPVLVAACRAALAVLDHLGLEGSVAVGHSLGEIPALAWAGVLDEEDLLELALVRGRAMSDLGDGDGAMASVAAPVETVEALLPEGVGIAGANSPRQTVVSGSREGVEEVLRRARERDLAATRLPVSHAFHSPLVVEAAEPLRRHLEGLELRTPQRRMASTVTGAVLGADDDPGELLVRQVTSPVLFRGAVAAVADEVDLWIELGSGRVLTGLVSEGGDDGKSAPALALDAGGPSLRGLLSAVGAAFSLGAPVAAEALFAGRVVRPFGPDRELRFLENPCERAPLPGTLPETVPESLPEMPAPPKTAAPVQPVEPLADVAAERAAREAAADEDLPTDPLELVRHLVAARAELPPEAVGDDSRLLSDLHLNSISVGQLVAEAARQLGQLPPTSPTDYASATVAEVARALADRGEAGDDADDGAAARERFPAGIEVWVRPFSVELLEEPLTARGDPRRADTAEALGGFHVVAPPDHPLAGALLPALATTGRKGVALLLPDGAPLRGAGSAGDTFDLFVTAARKALEEERQRAAKDGEAICFLVAQQGGGGGGFARTLHLEHPFIDVCVVDLPFDHPRAVPWLTAEVAAVQGYMEAHYEVADDGSARRRRPFLVPLPPTEATDGGPAEIPLGPQDVLLVTGGGKGIGAECALSLARETGVRLALMGRSRPEDSEELRANLERMSELGAEAGSQVHYVAADVTDAAAVRRAVEEIETRLGPVTGVLHSAGTNEPKLVERLERRDLERTLAPKVRGLDNLLGAVDPDRLRVLVTFGSIIARLGLPGEADYALANEWLAAATERFAREHPGCRCRTLEWSVWSGVGMGERLGRLESLSREGITAIPPDLGVERLRFLLAHPTAPVSVVVAGRFGLPPTLGLPPRELPFLRFIDQPRVHYPGVELVVDVEVSEGSDPYVGDHIFHGERLFPAVLGLEAMAQTAMALTGAATPPVFEDVALTRPVVVPPRRTVTLRVVALAREEGGVDVALRSEATGFSVDHFRARCVFPADSAVAAGLPGDHRLTDLAQLPAEAPAKPPLAATDLYGGVLFQAGRFRRVEGYRRLFARECLTEIAADGATTWFARHLPGDLVLGDPGARDATLHGIQPSIPHATVLPIGVDRLWAGRISTTEPCRVAARERFRDGDLFVYDVEVLGEDGRVVERWEGLQLKAVERLKPPAAWQAPLVGPYVERRLEELVPGDRTRVLVARNGAVDGSGTGDRGGKASDEMLRTLLGAPVSVQRRPDGKPEVPGGPAVSLAHAGDLVLAVAGEDAEGPLGCDLEPVEERSDETWTDLLGSRMPLVGQIAERLECDRHAAATRVWAAVECLKKAGVVAETPLVLVDDGASGNGGEGGGAGASADGWLLLAAGDLVIGTVVTPVAGEDRPLTLAVLTRRLRTTSTKTIREATRQQTTRQVEAGLPERAS